MRSLGLAAAFAAFFVASDAFAFCRTTTAKSPPDYDATINGCFASGVPLFWRNACVGYSVQKDASKKISYENASDALSRAFTRWTGASCPTNGTNQSRVSIDVRDLGPADCDKVAYDPKGPNQNVILFRDDTWPYPPSVLGLTTVVYDPSNGEIFNADMEINTYDMDPLAIADPVASNAYDFLSVVTHEAGHFLGMAHSDIGTATMFARYDPGQTSMRSLSPDDIAGICSVYHPDGTRTVLNGVIAAAPQCDPTPRGGYSPECLDKGSGCQTTPSAPTAGTIVTIAAACAGISWSRRRRSPAR